MPDRPDPTTGELRTLIELQIKSSESRHADLLRHISGVETTVRLHTNQLTAVTDRLGKAESSVAHALDETATLRGDVIREISGVHTSLLVQDKVLDTQTAQLDTLLDDKKAILTSIKTVKWLVIGVGTAVPTVWGLIHWAMTHVKF